MIVKFLGTYSQVFGIGKIDIDVFDTVNDLIKGLCIMYGDKAEKVFFTDGVYNDETIILINGKHIKYLDGLSTKLTGSDTVSVMSLITGG